VFRIWVLAMGDYVSIARGVVVGSYFPFASGPHADLAA
jgi:hypothetical protein